MPPEKLTVWRLGAALSRVIVAVVPVPVKFAVSVLSKPEKVPGAAWILLLSAQFAFVPHEPVPPTLCVQVPTPLKTLAE